MPEIRDPIHGDVILEDHEMEIIDRPEFQRLRYLSQLPTAQFVYPGATHSRFSHAIGVLWLADRIFQNLRGNNQTGSRKRDHRKYLRIAALLHDIETPPWYPVFQEHFVITENIRALRREYIEAICDDVSHRSEEIDPEVVIGILDRPDGEIKYLSQIIGSEVGANRLDYLMRDAHYCGVNYGKIDSRILYEFFLDDGEIILKKEALPIVDTVFNSMFQMKINVYDHRISMLATRMIYTVVESALRKRSGQIMDYLRMNDQEFLDQLSKADPQTVPRIRQRNLLKTAMTLDAVSLRNLDMIPRYFEKFRHEKEIIEKEIRSITSAQSAVIDFVPLKQPPATPIRVQVNSRRIYLAQVPLLSKWYERQPFEQWKMFVFCESDEKKSVRSACEKIFGPLEIGRETEPKLVISPLKELYDILDEKATSEAWRSSLKSKIIGLPKQDLLTLRMLSTLGPTTADEVSKKTGRGRSTESLILNKLCEEGFAEKTRQGKKVYFKPTSAVLTVVSELLAIAVSS